MERPPGHDDKYIHKTYMGYFCMSCDHVQINNFPYNSEPFFFSGASGREIRMANCIHLDKPDTINNHASPLQDVAWWQERSLMVRWVVGSILHRVDPLSYFSFQPVLNDWCNTGHGMCYPVCGMVHIKKTLLLIRKGRPCGGSGLPLSLSEWPFTI